MLTASEDPPGSVPPVDLSPTTVDDARAIRELVATWHRATAAEDVATVLTLMADDVIFLLPNRTPMEGKPAFEAALRTVLRDYRIESSSEILDLQVSGELAYCRSRLEAAILPRDGAAPLQRLAHVLTVLRKGEDGRWRVLRDANLPFDAR